MKKKLQDIVNVLQGNFSYDEPRKFVIADLNEVVLCVLDVIIEEISSPALEHRFRDCSGLHTLERIIQKLTTTKEQLLNVNKNENL